MRDEFDRDEPIDFNDDIVRQLFDEFFDKEGAIYDITEKCRELKCPVYNDGEVSLFSKIKPGPVKTGTEEKIALMAKCRDLEIRLHRITRAVSEISNALNDLTLGLANSFAPEYDMDIIPKGWAYRAKYICGSKHYSCAGAKEEWKKEYEQCGELFKKFTAGLECYNYAIGYHNDGSSGYFSFTVKGCPGMFEIGLPLIRERYGNDEVYRSKDATPMQMSLTWRRNWYIPVYDYFFDGRRSYTIKGINKELKKFVEDEEWRQYIAKFEDEKYDDKLGKMVPVSKEEMDETVKWFNKMLAEEIESCGKDGKKYKF